MYFEHVAGKIQFSTSVAIIFSHAKSESEINIKKEKKHGNLCCLIDVIRFSNFTVEEIIKFHANSLKNSKRFFEYMSPVVCMAIISLYLTKHIQGSLE